MQFEGMQQSNVPITQEVANKLMLPLVNAKHADRAIMVFQVRAQLPYMSLYCNTCTV